VESTIYSSRDDYFITSASHDSSILKTIPQQRLDQNIDILIEDPVAVLLIQFLGKHAVLDVALQIRICVQHY
jgi:hypothetical protein